MMKSKAAALEARFREVKGEIAERSVQDSEFRKNLLKDAQSTIEQEYGLPANSLEDVELKVVVESPGSVVIPIPSDISEMELSDQQLDQVAAGAAFIAGVAVFTVAGGVLIDDKLGNNSW